MRLFAILIACVLSAPVLGNDLAGMGDGQRCAVWATNAGHGARQFLRGAPRELSYIPLATLKEMIEHFGSVGRDKIYLLDDADYTPQERAFVEQSTLFGYDSMATWRAANTDREPQLAEWVQHVQAACLDGELALSPVARSDPSPAGTGVRDFLQE